ncbi:30S ribosomal protein S1 [Calditrichota bacterium]
MSEEKKDTVVENETAIEEKVEGEVKEKEKVLEKETAEEKVDNVDTQEAVSEKKPEDEIKEEKSTDYVEEVVKLEDIKEETEYPPEEFEFLSQLYNKTLSKVKEGDIVSGKILDVTEKEVIIDIGFKSEGIMPIDEFDNTDDLKPGDKVEVFLESIEDLSGQLILSKRRADFVRVWESVVEKHEKDEIIKGTITRRIKGGMVVNLNGVDAFLPGSQIDVKPIRDFDSFLGKEMEFKIVKVNYPRRNIVVSSRVLIEKEMESQRDDILETIDRGQVRKGTVKNITDFGVFIDLGGVDGLLHITDLSWGRVNHPSEVVNLDEEIEVVILDFNENKDRISLGRKQLIKHPWENIEEKYPIGNVVEGKVVSITDYGAFIELETGIEGLIHISEMSWSQHIKHPSQLLNVGQNLEAKVLSIESDSKKISLGLKQLEPDPWEDIEAKYQIDSKHTGVVRNLTQFGAFVELEEGIDGLVHISDLSWTKKIRHPSEVVKKGDEIEVVVLGLNRDERRIALGHKQVETNPWDAFEESYKVDTETEGIIARIIDKGIIVTLPLGVDGFIPTNHLGHPRLKKAVEYYKVDDKIPAKVIEFDKENKKIVLSVTNYFKDKEDNDLKEYLEKQGVEKTTLEDLLKPGTEAGRKKAAKTTSEEKEEKKSKTDTAETVTDKKEEKFTVKAETEEKPKKEKKEKAKSDDSKEKEKVKTEKVTELAEETKEAAPSKEKDKKSKKESTAKDQNDSPEEAADTNTDKK